MKLMMKFIISRLPTQKQKLDGSPDENSLAVVVQDLEPPSLYFEKPIETDQLSEPSAHHPEFVEKYKQLEKRLRAIEGKVSYESVDLKELSLVTDLVSPRKFKMPKFDMFDGTGDPFAHFKMFARRMTGYTNDDKLSIHCFQASLSESAKLWYNNLKRADIQSCEQLADAFLEQYKHAMCLTPDRQALMKLQKKSSESFRQYVLRWKNLASEVHPPMTDKEEMHMFINTLKDPYHDKIVGKSNRDFSYLIFAGGQIENNIIRAKLKEYEEEKHEVQMIHNSGHMISSPLCPRHHGTPYARSTPPHHQAEIKSRREKHNQRCHFTPIPMSYGELYPNAFTK